MSTGPGAQYKFSQTGIEDLTSKIKELHQQFASGQIVYKTYHTGIKEATEQGKAATQEFNQMKGAIAAANPQLLEFSRTMSLFGGVANTVLSVTNAINLAQLAGAGISSQLAQDKSALAAAENAYVKDLASYGPASAITVTALNQVHALTNQVAYDQQQLARETISTTATIIASGFAIAGSMSQTVLGFKALQAGMSATLAENFAIGLSAVGQAMLNIVAPIAMVIAGVEGIYQLIKLLDPAFADTANNLENAIMQNWHVNSIEAALLAPFVGFLGGVAEFGNQLVNFLETLYNTIVDNVINPLVNAWDNSIGRIMGQIQQVHDLTITTLSPNQILQGLGLGTNALGGGSSTSSNPNADAINKMLVGTPTTSTTALNAIQQNAAYTGTIAAGQQATNEYLNSILANGQAASQVAQQTLQTMQQQKDAQNALSDALKTNISNQNATITSLQNQLTQAQAALASASAAHADALNNSPNLTASDFPDIMSAIGSINSINNQITSAQQNIANTQTQLQGLDNATSGLGAVLSSLGLDSNTGIGSIVAGALGGYAGIGGAGTSAQDIANFAATGDYGIFTKNAMTEGMPSAPTKQDQINAWMKSTGINDPATAAKALGYTAGAATPTTGSANNYGGDPTFNPLAPGYVAGAGPKVKDGYIAAASGFDGTVSGPTHFLAGEGGEPEQVSITPLSRANSGKGNVNVSITVQGSLLTQNNFQDSVLKIFKEALKQGGW